jgi:asparagine synthase (glutamine-hydrolysing)
MCGLAALWNRDGSPVDLEALRSAVQSLRHRGPDDEGYVLINTRTGRAVACAGRDSHPDQRLPRLDDVRGEEFDLALGHRRLAIVDLSAAGHQPMPDAQGARWIIFNGMIHNFQPLRQELQARGAVFRSTTDTEVILSAYQAWGDRCLDRFNGMWAFVLWDQGAQRLFASRDRFGIKPLVYYVDDRVAAFSSELKALVRLPGVPRGLDPEALHHYLSLMKVPAPLTIYRDVRKVMPGHFLVVGRRSAVSSRYWCPGAEESTVRSDAEALEQVDDLLQDSVRLRLLADVPVGTFVSGGIDSSLVTAVAARHAQAPVKTFSLGFSHPSGFDESRWGEMVASHVKAPHRAVVMSHNFLDDLPVMIDLFDEPYAVSSVMGVYLLAREAARDVKVVLTGDGGDEAFAGYVSRYVEVDELWTRPGSHAPRRVAERIRAATQWVRWQMPGIRTKVGAALRTLVGSSQRQRETSFNLKRLIFNDPEKRALYTPEWQARTSTLDTLSWLDATLPDRRQDSLKRWQLHDIATSLHDEQLAKVDKATMAWGLEARVPLLDHRLVDLALGLPRHLKIADGRGKWILRKLGERYLPATILNRPKQGFTVPLSEWFGGDLRPLVRSVLAPSALRRAGIFRPGSVEQVLAFYDARPNFHTAHMVFTLLCFQMWHERTPALV